MTIVLPLQSVRIKLNNPRKVHSWSLTHNIYSVGISKQTIKKSQVMAGWVSKQADSELEINM